MKGLRTRSTAAGLTNDPIQFFQNFVSSLPPDYDTVMVIHDPIPSNCSIDVLYDHIHAIELRN